MIDKLSTFRNLNEQALKLHSKSVAHEDYLKECDCSLFEYFKSDFKKDFIFSAFSYKTKAGDIKIVKQGEDNTDNIGYNFNVDCGEKFENTRTELNSLIKKIDKTTISLTSILLNENCDKDFVLFCASNEYEKGILSDKIHPLNFNHNSCYENLEDFEKSLSKEITLFKNSFPTFSNYTIEMYVEYFWGYYNICKAYQTENSTTDIYIHFIKPSATLFDYNILLSLATKRPLLSDEIAFINLLMHRIVSQTGIEKSEEVKQHATRAAISQVMARNMSHNIGSHVMSNLTDGIELSKKINEKVICKAYEASFKFENNEDNIIRQLATYNNYVKSRMDYLSDITFGTPVMQTNKKVISELFQDLDEVRLLLDNISGLSKNFPYKINFAIEGNKKELTVAIPNDLLGCQAFYNIIENVIRNTAKHNQGKKNVDGTTATTNFFVNFKEISEKEEVEEKNVLYEVEIYDDVHVQDITNLVKAQNEKINLSVLAENNQLRNSALGLLEMEASAAYLRKLDIIKIESPDYKVLPDKSIHTEKKLNILKAFSKKVDGKNCLAYRFFVSKPTEYLFIDDGLNVSDERETELNKMGIWFRTKSQFKSDLEKENGTVFNHQFLFHKADNEIKNLIEKHQTHLPVRVIELNKKTNSLLPLIKTEKKGFAEIENCVWEIWFNEIRGNYKVVNAFASYQSNNHEQEGRYNLAFSDHLETWNISKALFDKEKKQINFLDALSSNAQKRLPDFTGKKITDYFPAIKTNLTTKNKLFESAIRTVLVMDERIQGFSELTYDAGGESVQNIEIFKSTNVNIPTSSDFKLDADNYSETLVGKITDYINSRVEKNKFLLIHYSILERMFSTKDTTLQDQRINEHLKKWAKSTRVVVTSGRGKPKELPKEVCYVNLSPVLNVFTQARSKYAINYLLIQARK